ncbi:hypothetical protein D3C80_1771550 [compost metagenome]
MKWVEYRVAVDIPTQILVFGYTLLYHRGHRKLGEFDSHAIAFVNQWDHVVVDLVVFGISKDEARDNTCELQCVFDGHRILEEFPF